MAQRLLGISNTRQLHVLEALTEDEILLSDIHYRGRTECVKLFLSLSSSHYKLDANLILIDTGIMLDNTIKEAYARTGSPQLYGEDFGDGAGEFVGGKLKHRIGPLVKQIKQNGVPRNQLNTPQVASGTASPGNKAGRMTPFPVGAPQPVGSPMPVGGNSPQGMNPQQTPVPGMPQTFGQYPPVQPIDPNAYAMQNGAGLPWVYPPPRPDIWSYITGMGFR